MKKIGVLGCGLMGAGIAQVSAASGIETLVMEANQDLLTKGQKAIEKSLGKLLEKGKITAQVKDDTLKNLKFTLTLGDFADCDLVIEAVVEDLAEKRRLFGELDKICKSETLFASNTSSLTVTEMAAATKRADRFLGLHFFNPVPLMKLVEVVQTISTSKQSVDLAFQFAKKIGKAPILCKDNSGFVVNLLLVPYLLDAIRAVEHHIASIEDIDKGMMLGCGHPMGPLTLLDFVGLDTTYKISEIMFHEYREQRYAPPPLLKKMVALGYYGKKSGRGFYDYTGETPRVADLKF